MLRGFSMRHQVVLQAEEHRFSAASGEVRAPALDTAGGCCPALQNGTLHQMDLPSEPV